LRRQFKALRKKAGANRPFVFRPLAIVAAGCGKNFFGGHETFTHLALLCFRRVGGQTNMRAFALGLIFSALTVPCFAQTILKSEPLVLAPYEIAFVQDSSCGAGKVLKVTGAIRGLHRKKVCVPLGSAQTSLVSATP
jgi:hypothetical protein